MYKDAKVQRKYQREWARNKRKGLPTKTLPIPKKLTEEEIKEHKKINNQNCRNKKKGIIKKYLGERCVICKYGERLITHRKDNKKHKILMGLSIQNMINELKSDKYVHVCFHCHKGIHWCIKYLGLSWEEILSKVKKT